MLKLFRVCRVGSSTRWRVVVADQTYGEYLDKAGALMDATEAATEARQIGGAAEVWEDLVRVY